MSGEKEVVSFDKDEDMEITQSADVKVIDNFEAMNLRTALGVRWALGKKAGQEEARASCAPGCLRTRARVRARGALRASSVGARRVTVRNRRGPSARNLRLRFRARSAASEFLRQGECFRRETRSGACSVPQL